MVSALGGAAPICRVPSAHSPTLAKVLVEKAPDGGEHVDPCRAVIKVVLEILAFVVDYLLARCLERALHRLGVAHVDIEIAGPVKQRDRCGKAVCMAVRAAGFDMRAFTGEFLDKP